MASLTSSSPAVKAAFALDVIVAGLALLLFITALCMIVVRIKDRPSAHLPLDRDAPLKSSLATFVFLIPALLFLAVTYAVQSATVVLQISNQSDIEITTGYSLPPAQPTSSSASSHAQTISGLSFTNQLAEILFTLFLTGAVWIHSSHITNNGTGIGQPSVTSKVWNTIILTAILGTGIAAWGRGLFVRDDDQSRLSYTMAVQDDQATRILHIIFRCIVIFASISVSIEVLRKWIKLNNNGKPGNPERPILQRFTFVVVPVIWLRDALIVVSIVTIYVVTDNWSNSSEQAVAFLLIIFGQFANLTILAMVLWGAWSMERTPGISHKDVS